MKALHLIALSSLFFFAATSAKSETVFHNDRNNSTIIELFTSQGCSSCPPAEKWLGNFKDDARLWKTVFPVAFHVDYWDDIGWKDLYAKPAFTQRQKQYKAEQALSSIYTPGFVVNGDEWRGWFGLFGDKTLPETRTQGELTVSFSDNGVKAKYQNDDLSKQQLTLNVAILATGIRTQVNSGENAGRLLPQDFTVLQLKSKNSFAGYWTMQLPDSSFPQNSRLALVAWINKEGSQRPLQVTGGWL